MGALAALSNFTGAKAQWKGIVTQYNLKWNGRNDLGDLVGLLYTNRFTEMLTELKAALETVSAEYSNYFRFDMLTGLRPDEACKAINLFRKHPTYLNAEMQVLEHFKFPELFIRNTKKAFVSVVDQETLEIARNTLSVEYQGLRSEFRRKGLRFNMAYCRKLFATFLRRHVDVELVDMLQGRTPTSIFAKFYNRPNYEEELDKVRACLPELRKLL